MSTNIQSFQLDRSVFQPSLYTSLREFWFQGVAPNDTSASPEILKRWFGAGPPEEKISWDQHCADIAGKALVSIGPEKLLLPEFKSFEEERSTAELLSTPFFPEVKKAERPGEVLLSLLLLLDQMPRNIYREHDELPLVYNHYDRLSLALLRTSLKNIPSILEPYHGHPVYTAWFVLPLVHSEDLEAHELWTEIMDRDTAKCEANKDEAALKLIESSREAETKHTSALEQFGRYPHRNQCLGRENTKEEDVYMETADTFGVKQRPKQEPKDEL